MSWYYSQSSWITTKTTKQRPCATAVPHKKFLHGTVIQPDTTQFVTCSILSRWICITEHRGLKRPTEEGLLRVPTSAPRDTSKQAVVACLSRRSISSPSKLWSTATRLRPPSGSLCACYTIIFNIIAKCWKTGLNWQFIVDLMDKNIWTGSLLVQTTLRFHFAQVFRNFHCKHSRFCAMSSDSSAAQKQKLSKRETILQRKM